MNEQDHSNSYLPHEVLSEIFEYLPFVDLKNASLVCKHWYTVSLDNKFILNEYICFDHISYLANKTEILNVFINSSRCYHNIIIKDCEMKSPLWLDLFRKYSDSIHVLMIDRCDVTERMFVQILKILQNLRKLELNCNNQLLMSGGLFKTEKDISQLALLNCDQLELVSNRYLSDRIVCDFLSLCPRIRHLSLKNSNISFHRGLYKRFYPPHLINNMGIAEKSSSDICSPFRSETVLTFINILDYLSTHITSLTSLDLSFTLVNNESLTQLATLEGLKLKSISLTSCDQISNEGFVQLFQNQRNLNYINVSSCSRLTDRSIHMMCQHCTDLRELEMRNCGGITDLACRELQSRIFHLHLLDISHCNQITGNGVSCLFSSQQNQDKLRLKYLLVAGLNIVPTEFQPILSYCTQLRTLDLSHCFTMVSDDTLRVIFEFCVKLTELSLACCESITDWGLIGLRSQNLEPPDIDSSSSSGVSPIAETSSTPFKENLSQLSSSNPSCPNEPSAPNQNNVPHNQTNSPPLSPPNPATARSRLKFFLGSRAEQDILHDTERKMSALHVMRNTARVQSMENHAGMCGLNRVRGLIKLNLYGCTKISDASLIFALSHLPFLQYLNLGDVQQISSEGIEAICQNNFRINNLGLHRCFNLQDADISCLASSFKSLQHLDLSFCVRLTDSSLSSLSTYATRLKYLNLQKCPTISPGAIDQLAASLSSLHTILSPSVTTMECSEAAPPAPPLMRIGAIRRN